MLHGDVSVCCCVSFRVYWGICQMWAFLFFSCDSAAFTVGIMNQQRKAHKTIMNLACRPCHTTKLQNFTSERWRVVLCWMSQGRQWHKERRRSLFEMLIISSLTECWVHSETACASAEQYFDHVQSLTVTLKSLCALMSADQHEGQKLTTRSRERSVSDSDPDAFSNPLILTLMCPASNSICELWKSFACCPPVCYWTCTSDKLSRFMEAKESCWLWDRQNRSCLQAAVTVRKWDDSHWQHSTPKLTVYVFLESTALHGYCNLQVSFYCGNSF